MNNLFTTILSLEIWVHYRFVVIALMLVAALGCDEPNPNDSTPPLAVMIITHGDQERSYTSFSTIDTLPVVKVDKNELCRILAYSIEFDGLAKSAKVQRESEAYCRIAGSSLASSEHATFAATVFPDPPNSNNSRIIGGMMNENISTLINGLCNDAGESLKRYELQVRVEAENVVGLRSSTPLVTIIIE